MTIPSGPGRNAERDFRGEKRSNEAHASVTDPDARLYHESDGQPSRLCYVGHLLIENRHSLIVDVRTTHATGRAEREAAKPLSPGRLVVAGSSSDPTAPTTPERHVANLRAMGVAPHLAQNLSRQTICHRRPAPPAIPATQSASAFASGSTSRSAGSKLRQGCEKRGMAVSVASAGSSP